MGCCESEGSLDNPVAPSSTSVPVGSARHPYVSFRTGLVVGLAVGYHLGAKAGRRRYEQIRRILAPIRQSDTYRAVSSSLREAGAVATDEVVNRLRSALRDIVLGPTQAENSRNTRHARHRPHAQSTVKSRSTFAR